MGAHCRQAGSGPSADCPLSGRVQRIAAVRPEFADLVWLVVTNVNSQVRLTALRGRGRFDVAVLGQHLDRDFSGLTEEVRESVISELIHSGGIEEKEKAAALAGRDRNASGAQTQSGSAQSPSGGTGAQ